MCYSFEVNITTWMVSFLLCFYMLASPQYYDGWLPLFILVFTQIQIIEAVIWATDNQENNEKATKILSFMLWLQPLLSCLLGYIYTSNNILFYFSIFYVFVLLYHLGSSQKDKFLSTVGSNGHLEWNRYDEHNNLMFSVLGNKFMATLYFIGMIIPFIYINSSIAKIIMIFEALTAVISVKYRNQFGSMWCYVSVSLVLIALLDRK